MRAAACLLPARLSLACLLACLAGTLRGAEGRMFEGVNLDALGQTQRLQDMPDIYERVPADASRFQRRPVVFQMQLGAGWLYFNPEHNTSYLYVNINPGEGDATYFGPLAGDAFETFKLEDRFISALRQGFANEVPGQIELMLRTGDPKLRKRAVRVMTAGLAPDIAADTRAYHVPKFKELAGTLKGEDLAPLRAAIAQTERRIEELTVPMPDEDYTPGNEQLAREGKLQDWMKPGVAVPETAWGEPVNGLRAAAVFSTTAPKLGQDVWVWLLVENASERDIRFGCSDVIQDAHARIARPDGQEIEAQTCWCTGIAPIERHKLRPGERLTLAKKQLVFEEKHNQGNAGFGGGRVADGPGEFRVGYESVLTAGCAWSRDADGLMHRILPAKGEWSGWLTTATTKVVVAGETAVTATPPAKPASATK